MPRSEDAFLRLPEGLDVACVEAWRHFVAAPQRSRELAARAAGDQAAAPGAAWAGLCLAYHQARTAEVEPAQATLQRVRATFCALKDARGAGVADVLQAYVDIVRGRAEEAVRSLEAIAAKHAVSATVPPLDRFLVYHGLALAYGRLGQLERVLQHHYANVVLLERCGSPSPLAVVLHNLSGTLGAIDDWDEAFATATGALRCCEGMDNAVLRRRAEINLALTCRFRGQMAQALELLARLRSEPMSDPGSDFALYINSAEALAVQGELAEASACLERARSLASPKDAHQTANCDWISGLIDARSGRAAQAIEQLERAHHTFSGLKQVHIPILPRIVEQLATCYAVTGDHERAFATYRRFHEVYEARLGYTTRARSFGRQSRNGMHSIESVLRSRGDDAPDELAEWARLNEALRRALSGNGEAQGGQPGWNAESIERFRTEARGLGVDAQGVGGLVAGLDRGRATAPARRVQLFALGRFEVLVGGEPLRFGRKMPAKPLALLKYLAASGTHEPAETEVADALWPDQDGDIALRSLAVNLHRLRKLLGGAAAIRHHDRRLALHSGEVWCDVHAFEEKLDRAAMAASDAERTNLIREALALYRGDFLPQEEAQAWMLPVRERLRARFVTACAAQGAAHAASGRMQEARHFYQRGLEIDAAVEELCLGLMRCSLALRDPAQGIAAFRNLERALASRRGTRPAAAIQALYGQLLSQSP